MKNKIQFKKSKKQGNPSDYTGNSNLHMHSLRVESFCYFPFLLFIFLDYYLNCFGRNHFTYHFTIKISRNVLFWLMIIKHTLPSSMINTLKLSKLTLCNLHNPCAYPNHHHYYTNTRSKKKKKKRQIATAPLS